MNKKLYYFAERLSEAEIVYGVHISAEMSTFSPERITEIEKEIDNRITPIFPLPYERAKFKMFDEWCNDYEKAFAYAEIVMGLNTTESSINITPEILRQFNKTIESATKCILHLSENEIDTIIGEKPDTPIAEAYRIVQKLIRVQFVYSIAQMSEYFQKTPRELLEDREQAMQYYKDYCRKLSKQSNSNSRNKVATIVFRNLSSIAQLVVNYSEIRVEKELNSPIEVFVLLAYYEKINTYYAEHVL